MSNYTSLAPEVETPHDDISSKIHWLRQITERMGADRVAKLFPHFIAPDRIQHARAILGDAWVEKHYPGLMPKVVSAETPEPAAPVVAETETPKVSVTTDCLMPDIAPAFRGDIARMPQLITRDEHRNVLAERRAIDIAYLHRVGFRPTLDTSIGDGRFRELMSGDTLDISLVREFATIVSSKTSRWSDEHLAEKVLFIPANLQVRLCQLATEAIKRKRARVISEAPAIRARLEVSMRRSGDAKNLKHAGLWAQLWVCDELIRFACGRRSPQEAGLLLGAMTGKPMARSNASTTLKAIDARLGVKN